jgi:hypothetical protein
VQVPVNVLVTTLLDTVTVPVGVMNVPGEVSVTVTVHNEPWLIATGDAQETLVVVVRWVTVIEAPVAVLLPE